MAIAAAMPYYCANNGRKPQAHKKSPMAVRYIFGSLINGCIGRLRRFSTMLDVAKVTAN
jgi:hypothetical protein